MEKQPPQISMKATKGIIVFVVFFLIVVVMAVCSDDPDAKVEIAPKDRRMDKVQAGMMAQEVIKKQLKSPSTADFVGLLQDGVSNINDTTFLVVKQVDSENSFGAMLRTSFMCQVNYYPTTDTYRVTDIVYE